MHIGVGVLTTQDRELHTNYLNLIDQSTTIHVEVDKNRRGVAPSRNRLMKSLYDAGCDHMFLFDDDTFPIQHGWQSRFLEAHQSSGAGMLTYPIRHENGPVRGDIQMVKWGIGFFTSLTRGALETVGYFNTAYDRYGHEDVAWLARARAIGLSTDPSWDASLPDIESWIGNLDTNLLGSAKNIETMSRAEKDRLVEANREIFNEEIARGVIYYPYDGGAE